VRRPFVFGAPYRFRAASRVQLLGERAQALAQGLQLLVLTVDDIAELRAGALQKGQLQFQAFDSFLIHRLGIVTRHGQHDHDTESAPLPIAQPQTATVRLRDFTAQRQPQTRAVALGGIERQ
jgi:hypothetical protein